MGLCPSCSRQMALFNHAVYLRDGLALTEDSVEEMDPMPETA